MDELLPHLSRSPPDVEALRIYVTLPLYHEFNNPKQHTKLQKPFASAVLNLKKPASKVNIYLESLFLTLASYCI